jgi:hypothetical protein
MGTSSLFLGLFPGFHFLNEKSIPQNQPANCTVFFGS